MLRQQDADPTYLPRTVRPARHTLRGWRITPRPRQILPGWRITLRRVVMTVVERVLGHCLAATATRGVLVLLAVVGLLAVITVTLSVGNALLVLLAGVIMRVSCEYRKH